MSPSHDSTAVRLPVVCVAASAVARWEAASAVVAATVAKWEVRWVVAWVLVVVARSTSQTLAAPDPSPS